MQTDMRYIIIIISLSILASCGPESSDRKSQKTFDTDSISIKQDISQSISTSIITFPCAILLSPSDKTLDSLKKVESEDFYTAADDAMFYTSAATKYFDSLKIKTIHKTSEGTIKFRMTNGRDTVYNLDGLYWDILLFNGKNGPIQMGRSDFDMEVDSYMFTR